MLSLASIPELVRFTIFGRQRQLPNVEEVDDHFERVKDLLDSSSEEERLFNEALPATTFNEGMFDLDQDKGTSIDQKRSKTITAKQLKFQHPISFRNPYL